MVISLSLPGFVEELSKHFAVTEENLLSLFFEESGVIAANYLI